MLRSLDFWLYEKDPLAPLAFEAPLNAIKSRIQAGDPYFEHLIEAYLINNTHRTTIILEPDESLGEKRATTERQRLDKARSAMNEQQVQEVIETSHELKRRQEEPDSPEALRAIPVLKRQDLNREARKIPIEILPDGKSKVIYHDLFTNGIVYLDLGFNLHVLPQEVLPYINLFSRALTETGTAKESFVQLLQRIGRTTGGIRPATLASTVRGTDRGVAWLFLRGKAMINQAGDLFAILRDVLSSANLHDRERFRQMALEEKAGMESSVVMGGHRYVNRRLSARFTEADWASEQMGGISYLFFLRELVQKIDKDWAGVQSALESIRDTLFSTQNAVVNVTVDSAGWQKIQPQVSDFLSGLPEKPVAEQPWRVKALPAVEGLTIPSQVNFVGKGANLYQAGYQLNGADFVVGKYLQDTFLWDKIRVQGGAYGGMHSFDSQSGTFNFLSYRDPNLAQSLSIYDQASDFLKNLQLESSELDKVVIGTIGDFDTYLLPDAKGFTSLRWHLLEISDEERQKIRDQVLNTSDADFVRFANALAGVKENGAIVVLGADEALKTSEIFDEITKVL